LKAARTNKDIDITWLGIEKSQPDPMVDILKQVTTESAPDSQEDYPSEIPEGVSLSDFTPEKKTASKPEEGTLSEEDKSSLLSALLGAKESSVQGEPSEKGEISTDILLDSTLPASSRFILILQKVSQEVGKEVPLDLLQTKGISMGLTDEEFFKALSELEEQGIIYRSSKGTVSYVDIEL